jgi:hypothetical protein
MATERFRNQNAVMTDEMFQLNNQTVLIDEIKEYAVSFGKWSPFELLYTPDSDILYYAVRLALAPIFWFFGRVAFARDLSPFPLIFSIVIVALALLFVPRRAKYALVVVDRSGNSLRYLAEDRRIIEEASKALELCIANHYERFPNAKKPENLSSVF